MANELIKALYLNKFVIFRDILKVKVAPKYF